MPEHNLDYYIPRLRKMIECKTISVKGSFTPDEFIKLREVMKELFPLVHQKAELTYFSDDCWIYKIAGKDTSRNIMVMSHHDVVEAEGEWKYPPFACEEHEGKLWGRGVVDTKTPLFAEFTAIEELLEKGFTPSCNLYIGSSHNEERAGDGIPKANEFFKKENITFDLILDEGGAFIDPPVGGVKAEKCAMIAVHEKGRYTLKCTSSIDSIYQDITKAKNKNPVEQMTAFIEEINNSDIFIRRLNPQVRDMFTYLSPHISFPLNFVFSHLGLFSGLLKKVMPKLNPQAGGLIGTTCSFNKIEGSSAEKKCTANAYLQPVSSEDFKKDLEAFRETAKKHGITVTEGENNEYHEPADISQPGFAYTKKCIEELFPQYPVIPFILPAGTDARHLTDVCKCALRFAPIKLSNQQLGSVHSPNENIDTPCVTDAIKFYKHFIKNYK